MLNDNPVYATIATGDLARARAFYEGTLGFKVQSEDPFAGVWYGSGGTHVFCSIRARSRRLPNKPWRPGQSTMSMPRSQS